MDPGQGPGKRSAVSLVPAPGNSSRPPWEIGPIGSWCSTTRTKAIRSKNKEHGSRHTPCVVVHGTQSVPPTREKIADEEPWPLAWHRLGCASNGLRHSDGSVQFRRGGLRGKRGNYPTPRRRAAEG